MNLAASIEAILFFRAEPLSLRELSGLLEVEEAAVREGLDMLRGALTERGVSLLENGDAVSLVTAPAQSELIEKLRREELTRDLGKAGAETLAIVLYRSPVSRAQIDFIRGVNSTFILRNLLIRGLVEKCSGEKGRGTYYRPTSELVAHLGVTSLEVLPEYESIRAEVAEYERKAREGELTM